MEPRHECPAKSRIIAATRNSTRSSEQSRVQPRMPQIARKKTAEPRMGRMPAPRARRRARSMPKYNPKCISVRWPNVPVSHITNAARHAPISTRLAAFEKIAARTAIKRQATAWLLAHLSHAAQPSRIAVAVIAANIWRRLNCQRLRAGGELSGDTGVMTAPMRRVTPNQRSGHRCHNSRGPTARGYCDRLHFVRQPAEALSPAPVLRQPAAR